MLSLSGIYLKLAHFPVKIGLIGGVPGIFFFIGILFFVLLGSPRKNLKSHDTSFMGFEQRYRCREVIFRCREVIFRCREVIFQKKWNENSGLPKFAPLAHANRSDQIVAYGTFRRNRLHSAARTNIAKVWQRNIFVRIICKSSLHKLVFKKIRS